MSVENIIKNRRTARSFSDKAVDEKILTEIIDLVRLSPSGANLQPLRYGIITDEKLREGMFPHIRYAGYIKDWNPTFIESPKAFIVVLCDNTVIRPEKAECDAGIAMMAISLLAEEKGLKSCILGAIDKKELKNILDIGDDYEIKYLVGLGYANKKSEYYDSNDEVKYSMVEEGKFLVPKKDKDSVILFKK